METLKEFQEKIFKTRIEFNKQYRRSAFINLAAIFVVLSRPHLDLFNFICFGFICCFSLFHFMFLRKIFKDDDDLKLHIKALETRISVINNQISKAENFKIQEASQNPDKEEIIKIQWDKHIQMLKEKKEKKQSDYDLERSKLDWLSVQLPWNPFRNYNY